MSRIKEFAREVTALRNEILKGIPEGEGITLELSAEQMAVCVYSLGVAWLSEAVSRLEGYETVANTIGKVSSEILTADLGPEIDDAINRILGTVNPEEEGDGA